MSATPPRARLKYSRVEPASGAAFAGPRKGARDPEDASRWGLAVRLGIVGGGLLAALLLLVSEFTTLYTIHTRAAGAPVAAVSTHGHDSFALVPIALLVAVFALGAGLFGSRLALLGLAALALVALGIVLIGDLPDAQATGTVVFGGRFQSASASPSTGFFLETLAAVLLAVVAGCGLLLAGAPFRPGAGGRASGDSSGSASRGSAGST